MPTTSRDLLDIVASWPNGLSFGRVLFVAEQARRDHYSPRRREFAEALRAKPVEPPETYAHPGAGHLPTREKGPLNSVEQAWLLRLPSNPAAVSWNDARTLASMAASVTPMGFPADRRLVDAVWEPVREMHDRNAAEVRLRNAQRTLPSLPHAVPALTEAIMQENPALRPEEAAARASSELSRAESQRRQRREGEIAAAQSHLAELNAAVQRRTAVTV